MGVNCLMQLFQTGDSRVPGVRNAIFEGQSFCVLGGEKRDLWKVVDAVTHKTLSSVIIPASVTNLTIAKCVHCYSCFTLRLPRLRWSVMRL